MVYGGWLTHGKSFIILIRWAMGSMLTLARSWNMMTRWTRGSRLIFMNSCTRLTKWVRLCRLTIGNSWVRLNLWSRGQSCKNLGSVVALLQGNFENSHDFKVNVEEKRAVLMRLKKLDDNFLPLHSITKLMSRNPKTFDHTHTFLGLT